MPLYSASDCGLTAIFIVALSLGPETKGKVLEADLGNL